MRLKPVADEVAAKADVLWIGYAGGGTRNIFANKPLRNMADLKGLKIRVQGAPIWSKTFAAAGMAPTVIAYNEVYNAIQNGVIAAGENEAAGVEQMKFYEVGPDLSLTQHAITVRPLVFSGKTFKKLPKDLQEAIIKAGKEAGVYGRQIESSQDAEKLDAMAKAGKLKKIPFTDHAAMKKATTRSWRSTPRKSAPKPSTTRSTRCSVNLGPAEGSFRRPFCLTPSGARMRKFLDAYYWLLSWLLVFSVAILIIPVSLQIFSRYTALIPSYIWTEEMARFFFIWMIMLGAMIGIRDRSHFDIDLWPEMSPRADALLRLFGQIGVLVMALVFVWYGVRFLQFGWNQSSELAELPMGFIFAAWPLTGVTWLLFLGPQVRDNLRVLLNSPAPQ